MKKMKKVLFLMVLLFLMGLGTAGVKAQVRIGGNTPPSAAAVLDLNATDATNNGTGGFTLPRVSLANNTAQLNNTTPITGMLVYNTSATLGVGIYFWNGTNWLPISGDGVIGNEVTNATASSGLLRSGSGTAADPFTLGVATGGVTSAMILDGTIATADIANNAVTVANLPAGGGTATTYLNGGGTWTTPPNNTYTGSTSITLNGSSFERAALTGPVTAAANSNNTAISTGAITTAMIASGAVSSDKTKLVKTSLNSQIGGSIGDIAYGTFPDTSCSSQNGTLTVSRPDVMVAWAGQGTYVLMRVVPGAVETVAVFSMCLL